MASGVGAAGSKRVIDMVTPPSVMTTPLMEAGGGAYAEPETYQVALYIFLLMSIYVHVCAFLP